MSIFYGKSLKLAGILPALVFGLFVLSFIPANAAEEATLMERWLVNDSLSTRTVDHSLWQEILDIYLIKTAGQTRFDYGAVSPADKAKLDTYLTALSRADVDRLNRNEQMAFWINAFNALAVRIVLEEYPVRSINDIGGGWFSSGPWGEKRFRVYLIDLSLNDIYHRILRPIWQDSRIHYALSCTALGCPGLMERPYSGETVNKDLNQAALDFVNFGPAILQLSGTSVRLSRIYDWYSVDFGDTDEKVLQNIRAFANEETQSRLQGVTSINGYAFDWSLNSPGNRY